MQPRAAVCIRRALRNIEPRGCKGGNDAATNVPRHVADEQCEVVQFMFHPRYLGQRREILEYKLGYLGLGTWAEVPRPATGNPGIQT